MAVVGGHQKVALIQTSAAQTTIEAPIVANDLAALADVLSSGAALASFQTVKPTGAGVVALAAGDAASLAIGTSLDVAGGAGVPVRVARAGQPVTLISDGTGAIAVGDVVGPSATVAGRVMTGSAGGGLAVAMTAAVAVAGTLFKAKLGGGGGSGGGISQLTQDVLAGPGAGSQAATVAQITGVAGVAYVVSGTDLTFKTGADPVATSGRINFDDAAETWIAARTTGGADTLIVSGNGAGGTTFFGDNSNTGNSSHFQGFQTRLANEGDTVYLHLATGHPGDGADLYTEYDAASGVYFHTNGQVVWGPGNAGNAAPPHYFYNGANTATSTTGRLNFTEDAVSFISYLSNGGGHVDISVISRERRQRHVRVPVNAR